MVSSNFRKLDWASFSIYISNIQMVSDSTVSRPPCLAHLNDDDIPRPVIFFTVFDFSREYPAASSAVEQGLTLFIITSIA